MNPLIYVVDDDEAVRDAVGLLMRSVQLPTSLHADADSFLTTFEQRRASHAGEPSCILLDIRMPGMSGLELQAKLIELGHNIPILFMTGHGDVPMAVQAMQRGAADFMLKPFRDQELIDRINAVLADLETQGDQLRLRELALQRFELLTDRERQIMHEVVSGKANKVIAIDLELSQRTVEIHRSRVMEKMKTRSLAALVRSAILIEDKMAKHGP